VSSRDAPACLSEQQAAASTDPSFSALIIVCLVERTYRNRTGSSLLDPIVLLARSRAQKMIGFFVRSGGRGEAMAGIENGGVGRLQSRAEESFLLLRNANGTEEGETF